MKFIKEDLERMLKEHLKNALKNKGYIAMELDEVATYSNVTFAMKGDDPYHRGLRKGFIVINFILVTSVVVTFKLRPVFAFNSLT